MNNIGKILVSIIVPVYGVEKWIEKCAVSAFEQDYPNLEFIFVNDDTKDNSIKILSNVINKYPNLKHCIKIISNAQNQGLAKSREIGIVVANGDFVFHLDADDWIEKNCISTLVDAYCRYPESEIISGNCRDVYQNKQIKRIQHSYCCESRKIALLMMKRNIMWNIWNRLIKRTLYNDLYIPPINNGEDYITTIRLMERAHSCCFISLITYNYNHLNENSFQKHYKDISNVSDRIQSVLYLKKYYSNDEEALRSLEIGYLSVISLTLIHNTNYKNIKQFIIPYKLKSIIRINLKLSYKFVLLLHKCKLYPIVYIINNLYTMKAQI